MYDLRIITHLSKPYFTKLSFRMFVHPVFLPYHGYPFRILGLYPLVLCVALGVKKMEFSSDIRKKERLIELRQRGSRVTAATKQYSTSSAPSSAARFFAF